MDGSRGGDDGKAIGDKGYRCSGGFVWVWVWEGRVAGGVGEGLGFNKPRAP